MQSAAPDVVTKGRFAELTRVSPGRVSQWISEEKISGAALVGEGREQRIRVEVACAQLKRTLDISQRLGNGIDTRLDAPPAAQTGPPLAAPKIVAPEIAVDTVEEQIKRARLAQIEFANRRAAEEEASRSGALTGAEAAQRQMGRIAAQMVMVFEGALAEFATALAARFEIPQRDALHLLRTEFRSVRARVAASTREQAGALPELAAMEIAESADAA